MCSRPILPELRSEEPTHAVVGWASPVPLASPSARQGAIIERSIRAKSSKFLSARRCVSQKRRADERNAPSEARLAIEASSPATSPGDGCIGSSHPRSGPTSSGTPPTAVAATGIPQLIASMIDDGIHDGDWIILQRRESAADGETTAVLLNGEVTLKKYYREGKTIRLQPANPQMEPLRVPESDLRVQGVVVGLMRKY